MLLNWWNIGSILVVQNMVHCWHRGLVMVWHHLTCYWCRCYHQMFPHHWLAIIYSSRSSIKGYKQVLLWLVLCNSNQGKGKYEKFVLWTLSNEEPGCINLRMICARLCTSEYSTRKDTCPKFESQSVADLSNRWVSAASLLLLDLLTPWLLTPPPSTDPPR